MECPKWLLEIVAPKPSVRPQETSEWLQATVTPEYAQAALDNEIAALRAATEGGRNHALNKAAFALFQLVKSGGLSASEVLDQLNEAAKHIGLGAVEIQRTLSSAMQAAEPRVQAATNYATGGPVHNPPVIVTGEPVEAASLGITWADDIEMRRTRWLWDGRLPQGALSLIGGREGIGKSTCAYDLAASLTRGTLPGEYLGQPKGVLIAAYEDDWARTIAPRLKAANADMRRVGRIDVYEAEGGLKLPRDVEGLTKLVEQNDVVLVLMDPLTSRLGNLDTHKDAEVRQGLEPMSRFANETECSVLGIVHVNKSGSSDPLTSLMGSRAFAAVARSVLYVIVDPEDTDGKRTLALAKNNLGRMDVPALKFSIEDRQVAIDPVDGYPIHTGKAVWDGKDYDIDLADMVAAAGRSNSERSLQTEVGEWLVDLLRSNGGVMPSADIKTLARKESYTSGTLDNARRKLRIVVERLPGWQAPTIWKLPDELVKATPKVISEWLAAEDDD